MTPHDLALRQTLGAGGLDVVGAEHIQHAGAHQSGDRRQGAQAQRKRRQQRVLEGAPALNREDVHAQRLAQLQAQEILEHSAQDEARHGNADHRNEHGQGVHHGAALDRRNGAQQNADDGRKDQSADAQIGGNHKGFRNNLHNRPVIGDGDTQITLQAVAHVHKILNKDRLIKTILDSHICQSRFRDRLFTQERIARQHAHHEEHQRDEHEQRQNRVNQTLDNIASQCISSFCLHNFRFLHYYGFFDGCQSSILQKSTAGQKTVRKFPL